MARATSARRPRRSPSGWHAPPADGSDLAPAARCDGGRASVGRPARPRAPLDAGDAVGVDLVERLALEQGLRQRLELVAVLAQALAAPSA